MSVKVYEIPNLAVVNEAGVVRTARFVKALASKDSVVGVWQCNTEDGVICFERELEDTGDAGSRGIAPIATKPKTAAKPKAAAKPKRTRKKRASK